MVFNGFFPLHYSRYLGPNSPHAGKTAWLTHRADSLMCRRAQTPPMGGSPRLVKPLAVIVLIDEGFHVRAQVHEIPILIGIDLLALERFQEAFIAGIVVGVRRSAHAQDHLLPLENMRTCI